jgi:predicted XRE-type DNA-binding protein
MIKKLFFLVAFAVLASSFLVQKPITSPLNVSDEKIEVFFSKGMSQAELDAIQTQMSEKGITLNYLELKFKKDRLTAIKFEVSDNKGHEGSAYTSFSAFSKGRFGFMIDPSENAAVAFAVGNI